MPFSPSPGTIAIASDGENGQIEAKHAARCSDILQRRRVAPFGARFRTTAEGQSSWISARSDPGGYQIAFSVQSGHFARRAVDARRLPGDALVEREAFNDIRA